MNTRTLVLIAVGIVVLVLLGGGGYLMMRGGRSSDLRALIAEARSEQEATVVAATPAPTPTPDAAGMEDMLANPVFALRLSAGHILAARDDIPAKERAPLLTAALEAEVENPSIDAPPVRDAYLPPDAVLRLALIRSLAELGSDALIPVRQAAEEATGLTREHLLVALAYLGEHEVLPQVRELLRDSEDPIVRMDAARALGAAQDREANPYLEAALSDEYMVEAKDSMGEFTIYPVREQAAGALMELGASVSRQPGDTFVVEGR